MLIKVLEIQTNVYSFKLNLLIKVDHLLDTDRCSLSYSNTSDDSIQFDKTGNVQIVQLQKLRINLKDILNFKKIRCYFEKVIYENVVNDVSRYLNHWTIYAIARLTYLKNMRNHCKNHVLT